MYCNIELNKFGSRTRGGDRFDCDIYVMKFMEVAIDMEVHEILLTSSLLKCIFIRTVLAIIDEWNRYIVKLNQLTTSIMQGGNLEHK